MTYLDPEKFNILPIYISKSNQWAQLLPSEAASLPENIVDTIAPTEIPKKSVDVIFPVLHGPYGEDGSLQGMLKMMHVPFVGCDVLASAMCMDKVIQKQLCLQQGLPIVPFAFATHYSWQHQPEKTLQYIANKLTYPLFVKPANQGSSIGVVKVHNQDELRPAIDYAFKYDSKIIVEQGVSNAREIECSVLGNYTPKASVLGEINPSNEFYDYDAKYVDGKSKSQIPAVLPIAVTKKIQELAIKAFQVLNCSGLARADFLVDRLCFQIRQ